MFSDIKKNVNQKHFCLRCLGHFSSEEVLVRHMELFTRDDFVSLLHVLPTPGSKQAQIKFNQYKYCTKAPFIIYADFESIIEPCSRQVEHTTYTQQHKVFAGVAILNSSLYNFDQRTVMNIGDNALAKFLVSLIVWEAKIVAILRTNPAMKRLSARQQEEQLSATGATYAVTSLSRARRKALKSVTMTHHGLVYRTRPPPV